MIQPAIALTISSSIPMYPCAEKVRRRRARSRPGPAEEEKLLAGRPDAREEHARVGPGRGHARVIRAVDDERRKAHAGEAGVEDRLPAAPATLVMLDVMTSPSGPPSARRNAAFTADRVPRLVPTIHTGTGAI